MCKHLFIHLFLFFGIGYINLSHSQTIDTSKSSYFYQRAFDQLYEGILKHQGRSFKDAVFICENAYWQEQINYQHFVDKIAGYLELIKYWKKANPLKDYRYTDSLNFKNNYAVYTFLKDTITLVSGDQAFSHSPMTYDFNDFFGRSDWTNMFVTKLMVTNSGNCHNLPYLYKILADEVGATCWLSLAPNHIYIKNRSKKSGWYNTELTNGSFPIDAWITASGYIPLEAIQNRIYMDTLSNQQAIALCVLDLAKGYEFQTKNYYDGFIINCCDLVLKYHPVNVPAVAAKRGEGKGKICKQENVKRGTSGGN